jgi:MoxR-like ATPase
MIGPTGLAKTKLSREVVKVRPKSRYVSARNSTGLSLTAMISKDQDNYVLSLGPVPLAKNDLCIVNEFDKMHPEQQNNLLDVMEEGEIVVNKFAKLHKIASPTTIIATANPRNNKWKNPGKIGLDEIPFESIILNRFDLVLVFQDITNEQSIRDFADSKTSYDEKHIEHNYNFLEKYIDHARTINPELLAEANSILNEYWVSLKKKNEYLVTNRTLESIHRIAKAFARLNLSDIVDSKIAYETIKFMDTVFKEFYSCIHYIPEPTFLAYNETVKVIQQQDSPIDLIEAVRFACERNEQIKYYIGPIFKQNQNKKLRELYTKVLENPNVQKVQSKSIVVRFKDTMARDLRDPSDQHFEKQHMKNNGGDSIITGKCENNRERCLTDHQSVEGQRRNVSKNASTEASIAENIRSQESQGSLAVSIAKVTPPVRISPTIELPDPNTMQIPDSTHYSSPDIVTCTPQTRTKLRYTDDGRHDGVFWRIYEELESKSDKRTVSGQELKARLISSNKFFVSDAVLITERMISTGQLRILKFDTYQRKND